MVLYTLSYDANGATGTVPDAVIHHVNTTTTVADDARLTFYTREFQRWNTEPGGGGTDYPAGSVFTFTEDTTLYAVWVTPAAGGTPGSGKKLPKTGVGFLLYELGILSKIGGALFLRKKFGTQ